MGGFGGDSDRAGGGSPSARLLCAGGALLLLLALGTGGDRSSRQGGFAILQERDDQERHQHDVDGGDGGRGALELVACGRGASPMPFSAV